MILYHFCPVHMASGILREGLTKGMFPVADKDGRITKLVPHVQWLTAEPDPRKQSWATSRLIPYSRTACRMTLDIPSSRFRKLHMAVNYVKPLPEEQQRIITDWTGSEKWYVFLGDIPSKWITKVESSIDILRRVKNA